jgi:hypothetical protein
MNTKLWFNPGVIFAFDVVFSVGSIKENLWHDTEGWFCVVVRV